jgi:hypothetical protein
MNTVAQLIEPVMPHLLLAMAAAGLFGVVGILILGAILFEKWYSQQGRNALRLCIQFSLAPFRISKFCLAKMASLLVVGLKAPAKLPRHV